MVYIAQSNIRTRGFTTTQKRSDMRWAHQPGLKPTNEDSNNTQHIFLLYLFDKSMK